jgi:hypothetical protein
MAGSFSIGRIIGPQTYQTMDAPEYRPAKITVVATQVSGAFIAYLLFCYYVWANCRKDAEGHSYRAVLPIVQEGVENTHYLMINYSNPVRLRHILVRNGQKPVRLRP